jgi:O-antigen/teichoic acid export membrane protein
MENTIRKKKKKGIAQLLIGFSLGTWISAAISFLIMPITTRLYDPEQLGIIYFFQGIMTILLPIICFGLDNGYVRMFNDLNSSKRKTLFANSVFISMLLTIFMLIASIVWWKPISIAIVGELNFFIPIALIICTMGAVLVRYYGLYYRVKNLALNYTIMIISQTIAFKIMILIAALWKADYQSGIVFLTLGVIVVIIVFSYLLRHELKLDTGESAKPLLIESLRFGLPLIPVAFISNLNNNVPRFFLRSYADFSVIGIYGVAGVVVTIINMVQSGFNLVWGPYVYANYKTEGAKIDLAHQYMTSILVIGGALLITFQDLIILAVGEQYRAATSFIPFLLIAPICYTISETTGIGINISKKSYWNIVVYSISIICTVTLAFVLVPIWSAQGAAIASAMGGIAMLVTKTIIGERLHRTVYSMKYTVFGVITLLVMATINLLLYENYFVKLITLIMILLVSFIFYRKQIKELIKLFKKIIKKT